MYKNVRKEFNMESLANNFFITVALVFLLVVLVEARPLPNPEDKNLKNLLLARRMHITEVWEYTFVVFIKILEKRCTGSILSELWVLTSAACYSDVKSDESKVLAGNRFTEAEDEDNPTSQVRLIEDLYLNPLLCKTDCGRKHDIMLVLVKKAFDFNQYVSPVQLGTLKMWPKLKEERCTVVSFGSLQKSELYGVKTVAEVTLRHPDRCGFLNKAYTDGTFACSRSFHGNAACLGDTGGPVICGGSLVAITHSYVSRAFEPRQCPSKVPVEMFTLVGQYRDWILNFDSEARFVGWASRCGIAPSSTNCSFLLTTFCSLYALKPLFF